MSSLLKQFGGNKNINIYSPKLTQSIVSFVISSKLATLYEITNVYDSWEFIKLYEIATINLVNKYLSIKEIKRK